MTKIITVIIRRSLTLTLVGTACGIAATASAENVAYTQAASTSSQTQTFDPSGVDQTLYAHQIIGAPYRAADKTYRPAHAPKYNQTGKASWYGAKFQGKFTASGERFDKNAFTAAHKTLPLNSLVLVTNIATGKAIIVRINDRGPFAANGVIDLSEAAASVLGYTRSASTVRVQYAGPAQAPRVQSLPRSSLGALMPQVRLPKNRPALPQTPVQPGNDNQTTVLTIKGPVHMASLRDLPAKSRFTITRRRASYISR